MTWLGLVLAAWGRTCSCGRLRTFARVQFYRRDGADLARAGAVIEVGSSCRGLGVACDDLDTRSAETYDLGLGDPNAGTKEGGA